MTSAAKVAANRRNAQRSTGPRSLAGKARARRNAFRHGLTIAPARDGASAAHIAALAAAFAAENPARGDLARMAAEAHLDVLRVRRTKVDIIRRAAQRLTRIHPDPTLSEDVRTWLAFANISKTLAACDRYERRALARRGRALQILQENGGALLLPAPERGRVGVGVSRQTDFGERDPHPVCTQVGCFRLARHKRADIE